MREQVGCRFQPRRVEQRRRLVEGKTNSCKGKQVEVEFPELEVVEKPRWQWQPKKQEEEPDAWRRVPPDSGQSPNWRQQTLRDRPQRRTSSRSGSRDRRADEWTTRGPWQTQSRLRKWNCNERWPISSNHRCRGKWYFRVSVGVEDNWPPCGQLRTNYLSHMVELKVSYRMLRSEWAAWGAGEGRMAKEERGWQAENQAWGGFPWREIWTYRLKLRTQGKAPWGF